MMPRMRSRDVRDNLTEDFEPATFATGPEGAIPPPTKTPRPAPPSLCEQGPCVHYHAFTLPFDAETPRGAAVEPGGKVTGDPGPARDYVEHHRYCYPTAGVEMNLAGLPVLRCNRWDPLDRDVGSEAAANIRRKEYSRSLAGETYARELAAWESSNAGADASPALPPFEVIVGIGPRPHQVEVRVSVDGACTLETMMARAVELLFDRVAGKGSESERRAIYAFAEATHQLLDDAGVELTNFAATLDEIGAGQGEEPTVFTIAIVPA